MHGHIPFRTDPVVQLSLLRAARNKLNYVKSQLSLFARDNSVNKLFSSAEIFREREIIGPERVYESET